MAAQQDGSKDAADAHPQQEEQPIPEVDGHQLDRKARHALVRKALGHDDQDHQQILEKQRERFAR